jgi:superfamily II DNA helicase RecQ
MVPIEVLDPLTGITAVIVERYKLPELNVGWDSAAAFHILLTPVYESQWTVKIGYNSPTFKDAAKGDDFWSVALIFKAIESDRQLSETELIYMKNLLLEVFQASRNVHVLNEDTGACDVSAVDTEYMRHVLQSVLKVLFLRGYHNSHMGAISKSISEIYKPAGISNTTPPVLKRLQEWRTRKAKLTGEPEYLFGTNRELEDISLVSPQSLEELQNIPNLSQSLVDLYGMELVDVVKSKR